MNICKAKDYKELSRKAANIISAQVTMKPDCVLGLATGSSPVGTYEQLIEWYKMGDLDFSNVTSVNLDEYKGLAPDNDQSYRYFMNTNLFDHVNIEKMRTYVPNGLEPDSKKACREYDEIIEKVGGIDLGQQIQLVVGPVLEQAGDLAISQLLLELLQSPLVEPAVGKGHRRPVQLSGQGLNLLHGHTHKIGQGLPDDAIQGDQHKHGNQGPQTAPHGVDVLLLIELLDL